MDLWLRGNQQAHEFVKPDFWEENYNNMRDLLGDAKVYVAENENMEILGFVGMLDHTVAGLFVGEEHRSKGIGRALLERCKWDHAYLDLQVYAKNERAFQFYQREGFLLTQAMVDKKAGAMEYHMAWTAKFERMRERKEVQC